MGAKSGRIYNEVNELKRARERGSSYFQVSVQKYHNNGCNLRQGNTKVPRPFNAKTGLEI